MIAVKTWQETAVEQLREAIIRGAYQPGQRLKQQELARTLGCSPVPVREALHRLAAEGFVVIDPQRGARVADFNSRELEEIYEMRMMLEGRAAAAGGGVHDARDSAAAAGHPRQNGNPRHRRRSTGCGSTGSSTTACTRRAEQEFLRKTISNLRRSMEPYLRLDVAQVGNYTAGRREHRAHPAGVRARGREIGRAAHDRAPAADRAGPHFLCAEPLEIAAPRVPGSVSVHNHIRWGVRTAQQTTGGGVP